MIPANDRDCRFTDHRDVPSTLRKLVATCGTAHQAHGPLLVALCFAESLMKRLPAQHLKLTLSKASKPSREIFVSACLIPERSLDLSAAMRKGQGEDLALRIVLLLCLYFMDPLEIHKNVLI